MKSSNRMRVLHLFQKPSGSDTSRLSLGDDGIMEYFPTPFAYLKEQDMLHFIYCSALIHATHLGALRFLKCASYASSDHLWHV